jgi:diguanylate cyclase (GGDEF)-like protein
MRVPKRLEMPRLDSATDLRSPGGPVSGLDRLMNPFKAHSELPPDTPPPGSDPAAPEQPGIGADRGESARQSSRLAVCTAIFFALSVAIVCAAILAPSNWHNPLLIAFIVALTVWTRSHSVKVTTSELTKDSHAFSLNGVCIVALAALNGPLPAVLAAIASEMAPFLSPRFHHAGRRSTVSDLACNLTAASAFALIAGLALNAAGDAFGHDAVFFLAVFAVSVIADFISLLIVAAHNYLGYRHSRVRDFMPYLATWTTLFPALALSTAVLVITLWVDQKSGPAAFSFAVLALVGVQALLARVSRVEYELRQERDKVSWLAHHDGLTGVWNRLAFDDQLTKATAPSANDRVALMFLDLDDFKHINDTHGHVMGDELLRAVAERLVGSLRDSDHVFRQGGDEFMVVARIDGDDDVEQIVARAEQIFARPFVIGGKTLDVTGSLGVAEWPREASSGKGLVHLADSRMYECKAHGMQRQVQIPG